MLSRNKPWVTPSGRRGQAPAGSSKLPHLLTGWGIVAAVTLLALLLSVARPTHLQARIDVELNPHLNLDEPLCYSLAVSVDPPDGKMIGLYVRPEPNCGGAYLPGTMVQLEAYSISGFFFDHWSGDLAGNNNPESLSMDGDRTVIAHYRLKPDRLEPDDTWQQARLSLPSESRSIYPPGDVDWFEFQLEYESWMVLETSGPGAGDDTQMWLYDSEVNELEYNDNGGSGSFSRIDRLCGDDALPPGTYFFKIEEKGGDAVIDRYDLAWTSGVCPDAYEPDNRWQEASGIESGAAQTHSIAPPGDEDWLTFELEGRSAIQLETAGPDLTSDTRMWLYDADLNQVAFSDDINEDEGNLYSYIARPCGEDALPAGTFYVKIDNRWEGSAIDRYEIAFSALSCPEPDEYEPDDTWQQASKIKDGRPQKHNFVPRGDRDWASFSVEAKSEIILETSTPGGDNSTNTALSLYDGKLNLLETDQDSGTNQFSRIDRVCGEDALPAGTYYVETTEIWEQAPDFFGSYALTYTLVRPCREPENSRDRAVVQPDDDAEERLSDGRVYLQGWDLELGEDHGPQMVGLRFQGIEIEPGAAIVEAYLSFWADEADSAATSLVFQGQAHDDAPAFSDSAGDLSRRPRTAAKVAWNGVPPWTAEHAAYQSPDLATIVQEVLDRPGWQTGNALVILVTGSGRRVAESYDGAKQHGDLGLVPRLHIEIGEEPVCYSLKVDVEPAGSGTVTVEPEPNCGDRYLAGTAVQLTANPEGGYAFEQWSGDASGSANPVNVTMNMDRVVTGTFRHGSWRLYLPLVARGAD